MRTLVPLLVAVVMSTCCATKKYVVRQVGDVSDKVGALSTQVEATQERTRRNEARIDEVNQDAQAAKTGASEAKDSAGKALQRRVTLINALGTVLGDSHFNGEELSHLENHSTRPEVVAARSVGLGVGHRRSASAGDDELYVAIRHQLGFVRVSISTVTLRDIVSGARRDVLVAGLIAVVGVLLLAYLFSRSVTRPVVELRDVARAIAAGDRGRTAPNVRATRDAAPCARGGRRIDVSAPRVDQRGGRRDQRTRKRRAIERERA